MFRIVMLTLAILFTGLFFGQNAAAQTLSGQFKDWAFFTSKEAGKKVCYITSNPVKKSGTYKIRGDVYMIVTYRGAGTVPEVSIDEGFAYKKGSDATIILDGKKQFTFFTSSKTPQMAWAKDENTDKAIVSAMKNANKIIAKGISYKGSTAQDVYSLKGFGAAYDKMLSACKK